MINCRIFQNIQVYSLKKNIYFLSSSCCSSSGTRLESRPPSTRNSSSSHFFSEQNVSFLTSTKYVIQALEYGIPCAVTKIRSTASMLLMQYFSNMSNCISPEQLRLDSQSFVLFFSLPYIICLMIPQVRCP